MFTRKRAAISAVACLALIATGSNLLIQTPEANAAPKKEQKGSISQSCKGNLMQDKKNKLARYEYVPKGVPASKALGRLDVWYDAESGQLCAKNWRINSANDTPGFTSVSLQVDGKPSSGKTFAKDADTYSQYAGAASVSASNVDVKIIADVYYKDPAKTSTKTQHAHIEKTIKAGKKKPSAGSPASVKAELQKAVKAQDRKLDWVAFAECASEFDPKKVSTVKSGSLPGRFGLFQITLDQWTEVGGKDRPIDASISEQLNRAVDVYNKFGKTKAWDYVYGSAPRELCNKKLK